ncbi:MAG: hypothetical protein ACQETI_12260, partial [Halobacteriota archaeon]
MTTTPPLVVLLVDPDPAVSALVAAALDDSRFTLSTDETPESGVAPDCAVLPSPDVSVPSHVLESTPLVLFTDVPPATGPPPV